MLLLIKPIAEIRSRGLHRSSLPLLASCFLRSKQVVCLPLSGGSSASLVVNAQAGTCPRVNQPIWRRRRRGLQNDFTAIAPAIWWSDS